MPPIIDILKLLHEGQAFEWGHVAVSPEQHAEVWVNLRPWLSQPELLKPMAWQLIRNMSPHHQHIDVLVPTHSAAIPLAYELAGQLKKPISYQRLTKDTRVLLVSDITRSGQTLREAASRLVPCQLLGAAVLVADSAPGQVPFPVYAGLRLPLKVVAPEACPGCERQDALEEKWCEP